MHEIWMKTNLTISELLTLWYSGHQKKWGRLFYAMCLGAVATGPTQHTIKDKGVTPWRQYCVQISRYCSGNSVLPRKRRRSWPLWNTKLSIKWQLQTLSKG